MIRAAAWPSDRVTAVRALIIGCGYVGEALGQRLIALGHDVTGIRRSGEHNDRLARLGIRPVNLDITEESALAKLDGQYDWVVIAASSSRGGDEAYKKVFGLGSKHVAQWLKTAGTQSVVFISSTSVYQQTNGEWIFENDADTGTFLGEAEQNILEAGPAVAILRSSGIYGPGRGHQFRQFMNGTAAIEGAGKRFLNMVHRDDLAEAIILALELDGRRGIYNITDDEPVTQFEFFKWLSETTGRPMPPFVPAPDHSTRKRSITNKRVSNKLFKETFNFNYNHPTFREGLTEELNRPAKGGMRRRVSP
jgi:nucleoside-diphosphate-sugar epimerase